MFQPTAPLTPAPLKILFSHKMELFLKITTTTLLLLALTLHPVHLENFSDTTVAPGRTISKSWLRKPALKFSSADDQTTDGSGVESGSAGTTSGSADDSVDETTQYPTEYPTERPTVVNETTFATENHDGSVNTTTQLLNSDVTNLDTGNNETVLESIEENPQNSTNGLNSTEVQTTTPVPGQNATSATTVDSGEGITNKKENDVTTTTTTSTTAFPVPKETTQETSPELSTPEPTTSSPPETSTSAPVTPDRTNQSDKGAPASGGTAERGFGSESEKRRRKSAWGAVLGTFVAIAVVGLVAYVILKKKHHKAFSHRKLEEDFPSDPVLRLDNSEPLDLNFGRAAYFNPGLQGDSIQMSPFPKN